MVFALKPQKFYKLCNFKKRTACRMSMTYDDVQSMGSGNMASSLRLLVRRAIRLSHSNVTVSGAAIAARSGCRLQPLLSRCYNDDRNTHFGFETVSEADKAKRVYKVFENVAQKYDIMNDAMSLGIHRLWKDILLHTMHPQPGSQLLDMAGGTGDIAFRFLEYVHSQREKKRRQVARSGQLLSWQDISNSYPTEDMGVHQESRAVVCDINKEMLKVGKQKADRKGCSAGLSWVVGDAEELPFDDDQFDIYTIAFGIRNVTHIDKALEEALRVLKPGGRFMCLEFSKVTNPVLSRIYDVYSFQLIPVLGEVIAGDWKSYQYLVESIRRFPDQEEFKYMIEDAGFHCVRYFNLTGGVVALHSGFKL